MNPQMHWRTPQITASDPRGLPVRRVAYLRNVLDGPVQSLISRQSHNAAGHLIEQRDPRLAEAPLPANQQTIHRLDGMALKITSVDAGWRLSLSGLAGEELQRWDERGNHWRTTYDNQLRVVAIEENAQPDVETFTYADASADAGHNLRGQLLEQVDPSGSLYLDSYGLLGQPLHETRTFDAKGFVSSRIYSPMGSLITQTDAGGHQQQMRYTVAGQLKQVFLQLKDQSQPKPILQEAQYNAAAQIETQTTANGVVSTWSYDPADGRLMALKSGKPGETLRQNLAYHYDPMGNVLRIEDHSLATVYFANQRVDGHRDFTYDSLYRLIGASGFEGEIPNNRPGLPDLITPIDTGSRYNYTEEYTYDAGNNLIELRHVRANNCFTQRMCIDPTSNRGVRCENDQPETEFDNWFDVHGNQLLLQRGQPMQWNARDELARVTLLSHDNGLPDDEENFRYSQGERVHKCHVTHTSAITHREDVYYLPNLEIRTRSNGEQLHVIILPLTYGSVRCLHWVTGQPADIEPDQLRYSLDDHLGSCCLELDLLGALISLEIYYPFGGTAWWAARSVVEADYKTIRYSGKEMDISGLYYYGARYYAPWLQRWVSADPAGDVDGLNLYAFVGNNPAGYVDINGEVKWPRMADFNAGIDRIIASENASYARSRQKIATRRLKNQMSKQVTRHIEILGITKRRARDAGQQLNTMGSGADIALATTRRAMVLVAGKAISYGVGLAVGIGAQALGIVAPGVGNVVGAGLGFGAKIAVSGLVDYVAERTGLSASVNLKTKRLTSEKIIQKAEYKQMDPGEYLKAKYQNMNFSSQKSGLKLTKEATGLASSEILKATLTGLPSEAVSAISSGVGVILGLPEIFNEAIGAGKEKSSEKMDAFESGILGLADAIESSMESLNEYANALSITSINGVDIHSLNEETGKITGMLHGFVSTIRDHRNSRKAAA